MKKKVFCFLGAGILMLSLIGVVPILPIWNPLTEKEIGVFENEFEDEDVIFFFKNGGMYSMKVIVAFPGNDPLVWFVRSTAQPKESGYVFRKYSVSLNDPQKIKLAPRSEIIRGVEPTKTGIAM